MPNYLKICCLVVVFIGFKAHAQKPVHKKDLKKVYSWLIGNYSSKAQHEKDSTNYYHIKLHMAPLWESKKDTFWLYVEQAVAGKENKPYRQRVYQLSILNDSTILSKIFLIKQPLLYAGAWNNEGIKNKLAPDSLEYKSGCDVYLHKQPDGNFLGGTQGKGCESLLRGASYATTVVSLYKNKLLSWDRGYDKEDKQAWGATLGGYEFIKE